MYMLHFIKRFPLLVAHTIVVDGSYQHYSVFNSHTIIIVIVQLATLLLYNSSNDALNCKINKNNGNRIRRNISICQLTLTQIYFRYRYCQIV